LKAIGPRSSGVSPCSEWSRSGPLERSGGMSKEGQPRRPALTPNRALQQTAGYRSFLGLHSSPVPRRCWAGSFAQIAATEDVNMIQSTFGPIHAIVATLALFIGAFVFFRPKATFLHRTLGYFYSFAMSAMLVTSFILYRPTGSFNLLHIFAVISTATLMVGLYLAVTRPRGWLPRHYFWMCSSYLGLCGALVAETGFRLFAPYLMQLFHKQMGFSPRIVPILVAALVFIVVYFRIWIINRNAGLVAEYAQNGKVLQ